MRKQWKQCQTLFSWSPKSLQMVIEAMLLEDTCSLKKSYDKPRQCIKRQRHYLLTNFHIVKALVYFSNHVWMWELGHKEGWALGNWCFPTVVLEKTLENPRDCKKANQSIIKEINREYSLERPTWRLKLQYFGQLIWRSDSLEKTLMLGKTEGRRRRRNGRGWDGWIASPIQWPWTWANSRRLWWTGKPSMLQSMGLQSIR